MGDKMRKIVDYALIDAFDVTKIKDMLLSGWELRGCVVTDSLYSYQNMIKYEEIEDINPWIKFDPSNLPPAYDEILICRKNISGEYAYSVISISVENSTSEFIDTFEVGFIKAKDILYYQKITPPKGEE